MSLRKTKENRLYSDKAAIRKNRFAKNNLVSTCAILILTAASGSFADIIGDWETGLDNWGKWDGSAVVPNSAMETNDTYGITLNSHSLKVVQPGWGFALAIDLNPAQRQDLANHKKFRIDFSVPPGTGDGSWIIEYLAGNYGVILNAENMNWTIINTSQATLDSWDGSPERMMNLAFDYNNAVFAGVAPSYAQLVITLNGYNGVSDFYFDNARFGTGKATNPSPADAAADDNLTPILGWTAAAGADSHNVYFGTTNPPPFILNQTAATYNPGALVNNKVYFWRIDEVNDTDGNTTGNVWYFRTTRTAFNKCTVKAGKTQANDAALLQDAADINRIKDSFTASGIIALPADINSAQGLDVNIISGDGNVIYAETINDFNSTRFVKSKYSYSHKITKTDPAGAITSLKIDASKSTKTFAITTKNINLTGLSSPVRLEFVIDSNLFWCDANEAIVNGKKLTPTRLMRMYQDKMLVTKATAKHSTKPLSDSLSVKGEIAIEDINNTNMDEPNLVLRDVNFIWGDQTFSVPDHNFVAAKTGHKYTVKKAVSDVNAGLVSATIDFDKCVFTFSVKDANNLQALPDYTDVTFGINYGIGDANDFSETADVNLVTRRSF